MTLPDDPEDLAETLNIIEPFAVKFGSNATHVTLTRAEARALIRWIEHYNRMRRVTP